jgi:arylsulfatase
MPRWVSERRSQRSREKEHRHEAHHFYNLLVDQKEEHLAAPNVPENLWVRFPASKVLVNHTASFKKEPPIRPGTPAPYIPKR